MKTFTTLLRHSLTALAGIGGLLLASNLIAPGEVQAANDAGAALVEPLTVLGGLIAAGVTRLAMGWLGKRFPALAEKSGASGGALPLLCLAAAAAGIMGSLPSCTAVPGDLRLGDIRLQTGDGWIAIGPDGAVSGEFEIPLDGGK